MSYNYSFDDNTEKKYQPVKFETPKERKCRLDAEREKPPTPQQIWQNIIETRTQS